MGHRELRQGVNKRPDLPPYPQLGEGAQTLQVSSALLALAMPGLQRGKPGKTCRAGFGLRPGRRATAAP